MGPINIVAGFDNRFAQHACVMLQSILDSNPLQQFCFYLLVPPIFSETAHFMKLRRAGSCEVQVISVPSKYVAGVKVAPTISEAAYYRLLVGELLPKHVNRVLYLDCDIVVCGDLRALWETDLQRFVLGAVRDEIADKDPQYRAGIGLSENIVYFNSGVLLIDLERWRQESIGQKVLEFCYHYPSRISHDQCALNGYLQGRYLRLDERWNAQSDFFAEFFFTYRVRVPQLQRRAVIVHFTCPHNKPWHNIRAHPLAALYVQSLKRTPYYTSSTALRWHCRMLWKHVAKHLGALRRLFGNSILRRHARST